MTRSKASDHQEPERIRLYSVCWTVAVAGKIHCIAYDAARLDAPTDSQLMHWEQRALYAPLPPFDAVDEVRYSGRTMTGRRCRLEQAAWWCLIN